MPDDPTPTDPAPTDPAPTDTPPTDTPPTDPPALPEGALSAADAQALRDQLTAAQGTAEQGTRAQQLLDRLQSALNPEGTGTEADPAEQVTELTGRVTELETSNRELSTALLVHDLAGEAGANPTALLDSRGFVGTLGALDPESGDHRANVLAAIKEAVGKSAAFRAAGTTAGGTELGDEGEQTNRPKSVRDALAGFYGKS